jgi:hypothetical protein
MIRPAMVAASLGVLMLAAVLAMYVSPQNGANLAADPSFELTKNRDAAGRVFAKWEGTKYEGECSFEVGMVAHSGKTSALLACSTAGKIRIDQSQDLEPGRYRIIAYIRGLDIGTGAWDHDTEFMFNGKYINLSRKGSFGWSRLTYVADLAARTRTGPSFGLWAPGLLWIDDVSLERVGTDVPLTEAPVIDREEAPIAPPGAIRTGSTWCSQCGYRNMPEWGKCYACGNPLEDVHSGSKRPPVKIISSFEDANPFNSSTLANVHVTDGVKALRIDRGYAAMTAPQDWSGYDFLMVDTYTDSSQPLPVGIEIQDTGTQDYWTRGNYQTVVPPGQSTLILPLKQLYVGEKSRPGRNLILSGITKLVFSLGDAPAAPLFLDKLRLERDTTADAVFFEGLYAFDFGTGKSPVMDGFTSITPATLYAPGRGYGLKNARIWRAVDALQPDPLYQDFLCIESGGLAVDVPNGKYRVFVNMDSPGGYWGETQAFRQRSILANGKTVVAETQDFRSFAKKYFQFWNTEDLPAEDLFDKYDRGHFSEKVFDVEVKNGQLSLDFSGQNWACSVSAVILFPLEKAEEGKRFLQWVREKRKFYFSNSFKRTLHRPVGDELRPTAEDQQRGYVLFHRDFMRDLYYNDTPFREERAGSINGEAFAGQEEPLTIAVVPLKDLGSGTVSVSPLTGPQGVIPSSAMDIGYVSYRITRVTLDGGVYTLAPRLIIPTNSVDLPQGIARQYWITLHTPSSASPGVYSGAVTFSPQHGAAATVPLRFTVRRGTLAAADIPAGPWGARIAVPWLENDPEAAAWEATMTEKSLRRMRAAGFTLFSGWPSVTFQGFQNGKPVLDFNSADRQMSFARQAGFLAVDTYGAGLSGLRSYDQDLEQMKAAGFSDYGTFVRAVYEAVQQHAQQKGWPQVFWNIGDEPSADALPGATENARAYRSAFPKGPPFFTAATSLYNHNAGDPYFLLAQTLHVATLNGHDEVNLKMLRDQGGEWGYYNEGSRWSFGEYMFKAVREFELRFRLAWHWNVVAGDPYYALDSREDDYAWANATPEGELVPSVEFMRITAGLNDYRYLLTLARLAKEKAGTAAAQAAEQLIAKRMAAFHIGERTRGQSFDTADWKAFREQVGKAIEAFQ